MMHNFHMFAIFELVFMSGSFSSLVIAQLRSLTNAVVSYRQFLPKRSLVSRTSNKSIPWNS